MYAGYELWFSYLSAGSLLSAIVPLPYTPYRRYLTALAVLHTLDDDPSERVVKRLIPRHEIPNLPQHIDDAVANAYSVLEDYAEAVDVTATVLMRIEQSRGEPSDFKSYLMVSVRNEAVRRTRWRKRHDQLPAENLEEKLGLVTFNTPEQELIRSDLCARLRRAINTLPERERELIYLHFYEDLSYKEIAELKGSSAGAVRAQIRRALAKLTPKVLSVVTGVTLPTRKCASY